MVHTDRQTPLSPLDYNYNVVEFSGPSAIFGRFRGAPQTVGKRGIWSRTGLRALVQPFPTKTSQVPIVAVFSG